MNLVDSSAWLEYFAGTSRAKQFAQAIEQTPLLVVPTIVIYEVFKKIAAEKTEVVALHFIVHMKRGLVVDFDIDLALHAAKFSASYKIPMTDSIILATAEKYKATIWTQDSDFRPFKNVRYFAKK